jgi:hypothetical protein
MSISRIAEGGRACLAEVLGEDRKPARGLSAEALLFSLSNSHESIKK